MLLAFMKARMNFIQIRTQFGKDEERLQTLATETVSVLRSKLSTYKLSLAEGTDLTQLFADQNILPEQTADELQSLVSLASGGENQQPASALPLQTGKGQSFKHFEHYLIQQEWQTIQDMRVSIDNKLYLMGARLVDLECLKADEHTFASLVAILIAAQPGCDAACVQEAGGPVALGMVVKLKNHFESLKAGSSNPQEPLLKEFPASPSEWRTMRPDTYARVYPNAPPVPCQLDPTVVSALKARVPCRKSKGSAQASAKSGARLALQDSPQQDLLENLVRLLSPSKPESDNSISALFPVATAGYQGSGHLPATQLALRDGKALPPLRSALSSSSDGSSRPMGGGSSEAAAGAGVGSLKPEGAGAAAGVEEAGVESLWAVSPGAPASESAVALAPPGAPASESVLALESMDSPSLAAAAVHGAAGAVPAMLADGGGVVGEQPVASTKNLSPSALAGSLVSQLNSWKKRGATTGEKAPASKKKKAKVS